MRFIVCFLALKVVLSGGFLLGNDRNTVFFLGFDRLGRCGIRPFAVQKAVFYNAKGGLSYSGWLSMIGRCDVSR